MKRNQKQIDRQKLVTAALTDEMSRFNKAISNGKVALLTTSSGTYPAVQYVDRDFWYHTKNQSWCGCNDGTWHDLMKQVGEKRNPLFEETPAERAAYLQFLQRTN